MTTLNKTLLAGNLTRDPELKFTASGAAVCNFSIAVSRKFKQGEEWKTQTIYPRIVTWGKLAENCGKYLAKGSCALVVGRLDSHQYETDGRKVTVWEIVADEVQFIGKQKAQAEAGEDPASGRGEDIPDDGSTPF